MNQDEKVEIVQKMQDYLKSNVCKYSYNIEGLYKCIGYSKRHADRLFKELLHMTPKAYVRKIRLSDSSKKLLNTNNNIVDIALDAGFESHEGFTRAFGAAFQITPHEYRRNPRAIPLFVQYPVRSYYTYLRYKEKLNMDCGTLCMITPVERPKRKLIILRSTNGSYYWSYCEEMGCEWEGMLNSITEKLDNAAIVELPNCLLKEGTSHVAAGVEVPYDYSSTVPDGYEVLELEAGAMLYFQTEPFQNEDDFCFAIDSVLKSIDKYDPVRYGYEYDFESAPKFNFGASTDMGAKMALPVKKM